MSILKSIRSSVDNMIDTYQKTQVMRALMELSDAQLDDIGVSSYELSRGLSAYPWRGNVEQPKLRKQSAQVLNFQQPKHESLAPAMSSTAYAPTREAA